MRLHTKIVFANLSIVYGVLVLSLGLTSCKITKYVPEGEYLLQKNTIEIQDAPFLSLEVSNIEPYIKQKSNTKILGVIPLKLYIYNLFSAQKRKKNKSGIGEAPVILDTTLNNKSREQIKLYLQSRGYLDAAVVDSTIYHAHRKKAKIIYKVRLNRPYTLQQISVFMEDNQIRNDLIKSNQKTALYKGQLFDNELFEEDRKALVLQMKNRGYFHFSEEHIRYEVDTHQVNQKVDVYHTILNPIKVIGDSIYPIKHEKYYFKNVRISDQMTSPDSVKKQCTSSFCCSQSLSQRVHPSFIQKNIFISTDSIFTQAALDKTYTRLSSLKIFKGINISTISSDQNDSTHHEVDVYISLPILPIHSIALEANGTNRGGNLGVQGSLGYKRRNVFKNAEILELKLKGGLEAQRSQGISANEQEQIAKVFNTLEYGIESKLYMPSILFPIFKKALSQWQNQKTEFHALFNYQKITWFTRDVIGFEWAYSWNINQKNSFYFSLADVNVVKVKKEPVFERILSDLNNPFFTNTYNDHFIFGSRLQYSFNSREINVRKNYFSCRLGIEGSGNTLRIFQAYTSTDTIPGKIFGIQYAQYIRTDVDIRWFNVLKKGVSSIYRVYAAVGLPGKNSVSLPFEKSYFAGGANGIRAWGIRSLGPGSFNQEVSSFYKIGDMQLEANAEIRFDIFSIFKGAFFVDAGNIWLVNQDVDRPNADFQWNRFYNEIALGGGLGLRLDFDFFIIRFDYGIQLRDPSLEQGERWVFQKKVIYNQTHIQDYSLGSNFNIGIGYPF